jgi:hypothetical protein
MMMHFQRRRSPSIGRTGLAICLIVNSVARGLGSATGQGPLPFSTGPQTPPHQLTRAEEAAQEVLPGQKRVASMAVLVIEEEDLLTRRAQWPADRLMFGPPRRRVHWSSKYSFRA